MLLEKGAAPLVPSHCSSLRQQAQVVMVLNVLNNIKPSQWDCRCVLIAMNACCPGTVYCQNCLGKCVQV